MTTPEDALAEKGKYQLSSGQSISWRDSYARALESVKNHIPAVLFGPPGTGKTKIIDDIQSELKATNQLGKYEAVQFHRKFSYEDFIEGYSPTDSGGFIEKPGVFRLFCTDPSTDKIDLFVIDEMNRAELSSTLGEVLYAIENRAVRTVKTARFGNEFRIPAALSLIGTMNTADRNISIVDYALRRRFRFIPVYPDSAELRSWIQTIGFAFEDFTVNDYVTFFQKINHRIRKHPLLGPHMQLGQSLFVPISTSIPIPREEIVANFREVLLPQIEAYFGFGSQNEMASILNPGIVDKYLNQTLIEFADLSALIHETVGER